jgi:hypothetical protein
MSITLKAAALALAVASLLSAGTANAACDGSVQTGFHGRTTQCWYVPTVSNGRINGMQKEVVFRGYTNPYGGGHSGGGVIGGPIGSNGNPVIHHHPH